MAQDNAPHAPLCDPLAEQWHARVAFQVASQLPDNMDDALAVIQVMGQLVRQFWVNPTPTSSI